MCFSSQFKVLYVIQVPSQNNHLMPHSSLSEFSKSISYEYYCNCAYAGRKDIPAIEEKKARMQLFAERVYIEKRIRNFIIKNNIIKKNKKKLLYNFFGKSIKQGVSFRLPLYTCSPTLSCKEKCYAHDGRDRSYQSISRGVINSCLIEELFYDSRDIDSIRAAVSRAVQNANKEKEKSFVEYRFERPARVRLGHVGDMLEYIEFTNWLANEFKAIGGTDFSVVIYTRKQLKTMKLNNNSICNLTIDPKQDILCKENNNINIVCSSWGGELDARAKVCFLEHHDNKHHKALIELDNICPVTASKQFKSCDEAHCNKCFTT